MNRRSAIAFVLFAPLLARAGLNDWVKEELQKRDRGSKLDPATAAAALKQALEKGAKQAVALLGQENGYFGNPRVKIPLPEKLTRLDKALRTFGQEKVADDFILSLNRAAEAAAPEAKAIFLKVIHEMSVTDAINIVRGAENAATEYFRTHTESTLRQKFHPMVAAATNRVGVTNRYKQLLHDAGPAAKVVDLKSLDIDDYVTSKALHGLFVMIADEEKQIRQDPAARTTELLKKVFGK